MSEKDINILDMIHYLESRYGKDKSAYKPNPKSGALGPYQLKRGAWEDIQRVFPDKWKGLKFEEALIDDNLAREAASDYLKVISMHFRNFNIPITTASLLAGYKAGMGTVVKGEGMNEEGIKYLEDARNEFGYFE